MKTIYILITFILISSCNQNNEKINLKLENTYTPKNSLIDILEKEKTFAEKQLNLVPFRLKQFNGIRIWRFPGGGAVFTELYELKANDSIITYYSSIVRNLNERETVNKNKIESIIKIKDEKLLKELSNFIKRDSFLKIENSYERCNSKPYCGDVFLIEFNNRKFCKVFEMQSNIKDCKNKDSEILKYLLFLIEKITEKYGK